MTDRIKMVLGITFFFAVCAGLFGPLFGYEKVVATERSCYNHQIVDHTLQYWCATLGLIVGIAYAVYDYLRSKKALDNVSE